MLACMPVVVFIVYQHGLWSRAMACNGVQALFCSTVSVLSNKESGLKS